MCYKQKFLSAGLLLLLIIIGSTELLHAQNEAFNPEFYAQRSQIIQKNGMIVLGSWATINIFSGTAGYFLSENSTRYFHQMNAAWNLVNLSIAGISLYKLHQTDIQAQTYTHLLNEAQSLDRFLLLNTGLDIAYMATGAWLWERGIRTDSDRLTGYGKSLVLQGGFLLAFDLILFAVHSPVTNDLLQLSEKISFNGNGLTVRF